jgi:hypothetical protein
MSATEHDDVKKPSVPLVGKGVMTEAERAFFLQQARADEKAYSADLAAKDKSHYLYNPILDKGAGDYSHADHPLSHKISAQTATLQSMKTIIHKEFDTNSPSFAFHTSLQEYAKRTASLMNDKATLAGYYGVNEPHGAAQPVSTAPTHTSAAVQSVKAPMSAIHNERLAINLPPDMLDVMDAHELKAYHAKLDNHVGELAQKHGPKVLAAIGLMTAAETVFATPGSMTEKLDAAGRVLKGHLVDAIPGVTYTQKMAAGKYQEARLDAATYLPLGDAVGIARSPEAQAVIDVLPKDRAGLESMQQDKIQAPINRHLAEYQLAFIDAKEKGDLFKGLSASSHLTELAEQKIVLQAQWKKSADHFIAATKDAGTNWLQLAKNSDIAPQAAIHLAAINSGYPAAFVEKMDATLAKNMATGTPVSPEMMAITKSVQVRSTLNCEVGWCCLYGTTAIKT